MILWLNGAFGSGKTHTAFALHRRLPDSFVYDPENAGFFIRNNLPASMQTTDFQDDPLWCSLNLALLRRLAREYHGPVIVPMTITDRRHFDALVGTLAEEYPVCHVILSARRETLLRRLRSRGESGHSWAAQQIDRCLAAFDETSGVFPGETRLQTDGLRISQTAEAAAALAGLELKPDCGGLRRLREELLVTIRHIR